LAKKPRCLILAGARSFKRFCRYNLGVWFCAVDACRGLSHELCAFLSVFEIFCVALQVGSDRVIWRPFSGRGNLHRRCFSHGFFARLIGLAFHPDFTAAIILVSTGNFFWSGAARGRISDVRQIIFLLFACGLLFFAIRLLSPRFHLLLGRVCLIYLRSPSRAVSCSGSLLARRHHVGSIGPLSPPIFRRRERAMPPSILLGLVAIRCSVVVAVVMIGRAGVIRYASRRHLFVAVDET